MSFGVGSQLDEMALGEAWAGSPMNGVDIDAEMGVSIAGNRWHSRMTIDLWSVVIIVGALALLWLLGGVVFRRVNVL